MTDALAVLHNFSVIKHPHKMINQANISFSPKSYFPQRSCIQLSSTYRSWQLSPRLHLLISALAMGVVNQRIKVVVQQPVYRMTNWPAWLREICVNLPHFLLPGSSWTVLDAFFLWATLGKQKYTKPVMNKTDRRAYHKQKSAPKASLSVDIQQFHRHMWMTQDYWLDSPRLCCPCGSYS